MQSLNELLKQRAELDQQINEVRKRESAEALAKIKALVKEFEFQPNDIFGSGKGASTAGRKVAPKYRNPATGETWTGRGKAPLWIQDKDKSQFLI